MYVILPGTRTEREQGYLKKEAIGDNSVIAPLPPTPTPPQQINITHEPASMKCLKAKGIGVVIASDIVIQSKTYMMNGLAKRQTCTNNRAIYTCAFVYYSTLVTTTPANVCKTVRP